MNDADKPIMSGVACPTCGSTEPHTHDADVTAFFCAPACKKAFDRDPQAHLVS
jgi:hypothetical protein